MPRIAFVLTIKLVRDIHNLTCVRGISIRPLFKYARFRLLRCEVKPWPWHSLSISGNFDLRNPEKK